MNSVSSYMHGIGHSTVFGVKCRAVILRTGNKKESTVVCKGESRRHYGLSTYAKPHSALCDVSGTVHRLMFIGDLQWRLRILHVGCTNTSGNANTLLQFSLIRPITLPYIWAWSMRISRHPYLPSALWLLKSDSVLWLVLHTTIQDPSHSSPPLREPTRSECRLMNILGSFWLAIRNRHLNWSTAVKCAPLGYLSRGQLQMLACPRLCPLRSVIGSTPYKPGSSTAICPTSLNYGTSSDWVILPSAR